MQIFQIKTIHAGSDTNLLQKQEYEFTKEFWPLPSLQQSVLPLTTENRRRRRGGSSTKHRYRQMGGSYFHKLLNNHIDVVILCCDLEIYHLLMLL